MAKKSSTIGSSLNSLKNSRRCITIIRHFEVYIVKFLLNILIIFSARICDTEMRKSIHKEWLETTRPGSSEDMARLTDEHRIFVVEEMVKSGSAAGTKEAPEVSWT